MSNSMIEEVVEVSGPAGGVREYTVSGLLGDQRTAQQGSRSEPDVCIRVMIFQTVPDTEGQGTKTAFAMSDGKIKAELTNGHRPWTATMTPRTEGRDSHLSLPDFDTTRPATGLAVSVDCKDDLPGFEIFTWSGPIRFHLTASPA